MKEVLEEHIVEEVLEELVVVHWNRTAWTPPGSLGRHGRLRKRCRPSSSRTCCFTNGCNHYIDAAEALEAAKLLHREGDACAVAARASRWIRCTGSSPPPKSRMPQRGWDRGRTHMARLRPGRWSNTPILFGGAARLQLHCRNHHQTWTNQRAKACQPPWTLPNDRSPTPWSACSGHLTSVVVAAAALLPPSLLLLLFSFCRSFYLLRSQRQVFVKLNTFLEHRYFQNLLSTHKKIWPRHSSDDASSVCARHKFYVRRLGSTDCIASTALKIIKSWIFK